MLVLGNDVQVVIGQVITRRNQWTAMKDTDTRAPKMGRSQVGHGHDLVIKLQGLTPQCSTGGNGGGSGQRLSVCLNGGGDLAVLWKDLCRLETGGMRIAYF